MSSVTFNDIERYFGARKIDTGTGLFRSLNSMSNKNMVR